MSAFIDQLRAHAAAMLAALLMTAICGGGCSHVGNIAPREEVYLPEYAPELYSNAEQVLRKVWSMLDSSACG